MPPTTILKLLPLFAALSLSATAQTVEPEKAPPAPATASTPKTLPGPWAALVKSGNYVELQKKVLSAIKSVNKPGAQIDGLLKKNQYRQAIALAEVIRVTSPEAMAEFHKTCPHAAAFLNCFLADTNWMELYLGVGMVPEKTAAGLKVMADIWKEDGSSTDFEKFIPLTCGLASVWAAGPFSNDFQLWESQGDTKHDPVRRYQFFKKQQKAGLLHPGFMKLRPWEMCFIVGHRWDDESFEWVAQNVNVPPRRYTDACWFAEYTGTNFFGDSIQGPLFFVPWKAESSDAEGVKKRGGVCGSLSHLGAIAAMAHGIPAYTVGQPGHCAYGVRIKRGDWQGGFGGPDGGMHNHIFGSQAPTSYMLMEKVFANDATIDNAYRHTFHARAMEELGNERAAIAAWESALQISPLHPFFRKELHRLYQEKGNMKPAEWFAYAQKALPAYKGNGVAATEAFAEPESVFLSAIPEKSRLAWFRSLHQALATTPPSWALKFDTMLEKQTGSLDTPAAKEQFLTDMFSIHLNQGDGTNFGQALEWSVKTFVDGGQSDIFSKAFAAAAKSSGGQGAQASANSGKLKDAYNKAIVAAEKAHSRTAFQALSKAASQYVGIDTKSKTFNTAPPSGTLVPPSGLVRISTTSQWDKPAEHIYMLMPCGGSCHTDREAAPNIIVELPETIKLSGLIVTKQNDHQGRMKKMTVSTSTDGATWFPLEEIDDMPSEWKIETKKDTSAKWIKIEAVNPDPEFMHLKHILIYKR